MKMSTTFKLSQSLRTVIALATATIAHVSAMESLQIKGDPRFDGLSFKKYSVNTYPDCFKPHEKLIWEEDVRTCGNHWYFAGDYWIYYNGDSKAWVLESKKRNNKGELDLLYAAYGGPYAVPLNPWYRYDGDEISGRDNITLEFQTQRHHVMGSGIKFNRRTRESARKRAAIKKLQQQFGMKSLKDFDKQFRPGNTMSCSQDLAIDLYLIMFDLETQKGSELDHAINYVNKCPDLSQMTCSPDKKREKTESYWRRYCASNDAQRKRLELFEKDKEGLLELYASHPNPNRRRFMTKIIKRSLNSKMDNFKTAVNYAEKTEAELRKRAVKLLNKYAQAIRTNLQTYPRWAQTKN